MWKILKIAGITIAVIALLIIGAILGLTNTDFGRERVRRIAVSAMNKSIHGVTRIGRVDGNLLRGITLRDLSITDSAGAPFFSSPLVQARYSIGNFLSKHIIIDALGRHEPSVVLDKKPGGDWNFTTLFASADTTKKDTTRGFGSWITLRNVRMSDGHVLVRMPWTPGDSLPQAVRDSVVRVALAGKARQRVIEAPGGYQSVMEFGSDATRRCRAFGSRIPTAPRAIFQVGSLAMTAALFNPPDADVRDLRGTIYMSTDSLWFRGLAAALPNTQLRGDVTYMLSSGDLDASFHAAPLALADLALRLSVSALERRRLDGSHRGDAARGRERLRARNIDLSVQGGTLKGELGLAMGQRAGEMRMHDTQLAFNSIDTRTIEQLVPTVKVPRRGLLTGRATLAGTPAAMQRGCGRCVRGPTIGNEPRARGRCGGLRTPWLQREESASHDLTAADGARARVRSVAARSAACSRARSTVDGSLAGRMTASADLAHHEGGELTRMVANGEVIDAGKHGVTADMRFDPISLITAGKFAPALGLRGTASGTVHLGGSMRALDLAADLHLPDGGELATNGQARSRER